MRGEPGFFDVEERLKELSAKGDELVRLNAVVDFERFRGDLERAVPRSDRLKGGRPAFDHVLMFKTLILQASHNLSDERTEYLIRDRLSFMRFLGLGLADTVPDANTIWGFREALTRAKLAGKPAIEVLFEGFDAALARAGFLAMSGQIIDASIVAAPKQRNTDDEKRDIKEGRIPPEWANKPAKLRQKDRDARWTVKYTKAKHDADGRKRVDLAIPAFGYKNHIGIDRRHGLIRRWTVTDASRHDGALLPQLIDTDNTAGKVWADTAYRSKANERFLAAACACKSTRKSLKAGQCHAAPLVPTRANRQCAPRSSTSSPGKKGQWACSSAPSALPEPKPRSASPTSSTICSEWSGSPPAPQRHDPLNRPPERQNGDCRRPITGVNQIADPSPPRRGSYWRSPTIKAVDVGCCRHEVWRRHGSDAVITK